MTDIVQQAGGYGAATLASRQIAGKREGLGDGRYTEAMVVTILFHGGLSHVSCANVADGAKKTDFAKPLKS